MPARVLFAPTAEEDRYLPEGPRAVRVGGRDALSWVNIQTGPNAAAGAIHLRFWDTGERRKVALPARPGFAFPTDAPDTLFVGLEKAVGTLNLASGVWTPYAKIADTNPRTIINDGEIVPGGRAVVFGTKDTKFADTIAELYLFTLPDGRIAKLAGGQTCSNGKVIRARADGRCDLFDIDTPTKKVVRYTLDVAARSVDVPTTVIDLTQEPAYPDGMCDDGSGGFLIAFYNPHRGGDGAVRRFDAHGTQIDEWLIPGSPRVTCPARVGRMLVLTTANEGMPAEQRAASPDAGSLFVFDIGLPAGAAEVVRL